MEEDIIMINVDEFIREYNKFYGTCVRVINTDTLEFDGIVMDLYGSDDYEFEDGYETIIIY